MLVKKIRTKCHICNRYHYIEENKAKTIFNLCLLCQAELKKFEESFKKRILAQHHHKAVGACTWEQFRITLLKNKMRCYYSNVRLTVENWSIEHIHPTSDYQKSSSTKENLIPVLKSINISKGDKDFKTWYTKELPFYSATRYIYILGKFYYPALIAREKAEKEAEEHKAELERIAQEKAQKEAEEQERAKKRAEENNKRIKQEIEEMRKKFSFKVSEAEQGTPLQRGQIEHQKRLKRAKTLFYNKEGLTTFEDYLSLQEFIKTIPANTPKVEITKEKGILWTNPQGITELVAYLPGGKP